MICIVEIWKHYHIGDVIVDTHTSESVWECVKWFQKEYKVSYDLGECYFEVYINDTKLTFEEKNAFGFYE